MGLLKRLGLKLGFIYDVHVPISEYSEKQIIKRISKELGKDAVHEYVNIGVIGVCNFLVCDGGYFPYDMNYLYFVNDFYKEAVILKAKSILYESLAGYKNEDKKKREEKQVLSQIYEIANSYAKAAREALESEEQNNSSINSEI